MKASAMFDFVTFVATLGCALMAGLFFAFSVAVMKALGRLPPAHGIAAMQSINVVILNRWFLGVFFGTAAASVVAAGLALLSRDGAGAGFALTGALLYLLGTFGVTIVFNVPRNDALARVEPGSPEGGRVWDEYLAGWTAWNHVRTVAALAATAAFVAALSAVTQT